MGWPADKVRRVAESFLKLVAIATVADVVPLTGENRVFVSHGLRGLGSVRNPGLRALLDVAGFTPDKDPPNARQVAFQVAPRMNAAGRMDTARAVVELFLTGDAAVARDLAKQLHDQNAERQQVEAEIRDACEQIDVADHECALVYFAENWHRGVLGIVASRLVERLHRPVFVLSRADDGTAQGSGRSIPAFHLLDALESMPDLFLRFGGHEHAAGVTMEAVRVPEFRERFNAYAAARLAPEDFLRRMEIDAVAELRDISERAIEEVFSLAPFGHGNPAPLFAALNVEVAGQPVVWKERHLRVMVRQNGRSLALKAWNMAERATDLAPGSRVDIAFALEEDAYSAARGYPGWAAVLRDFRGAIQSSS
jgi:single-stranded-DNA-specific exonuclease